MYMQCNGDTFHLWNAGLKVHQDKLEFYVFLHIILGDCTFVL